MFTLVYPIKWEKSSGSQVYNVILRLMMHRTKAIDKLFCSVAVTVGWNYTLFGLHCVLIFAYNSVVF